MAGRCSFSTGSATETPSDARREEAVGSSSGSRPANVDPVIARIHQVLANVEPDTCMNKLAEVLRAACFSRLTEINLKLQEARLEAERAREAEAALRRELQAAELENERVRAMNLELMQVNAELEKKNRQAMSQSVPRRGSVPRKPKPVAFLVDSESSSSISPTPTSHFKAANELELNQSFEQELSSDSQNSRQIDKLIESKARWAFREAHRRLSPPAFVQYRAMIIDAQKQYDAFGVIDFQLVDAVRQLTRRATGDAELLRITDDLLQVVFRTLKA